MSAWHRTYVSVFVANMVTAVGMMSFLPFFPTLLESVGVTDRDELEIWSGLIAGAAPLTAAFMGPVWGSLGDRVGRKVMVLRSIFAITVFVGLLGVAQTPLQLLFLRLCQGTFSGFVPPSMTLVSVMTPPEKQGRVIGSLQMALPVGMMVGPQIGAWIGTEYGIQSVFLFVAVISGLSGLLVWALAHEESVPTVGYERFSVGAVLGEAWSDLVRMLGRVDIRFAFLTLFVVQLGAGMINPQLELAVRDIATGTPEVLAKKTAYLFSGFAAMSFCTNFLWGIAGDRFGPKRCLFFVALGAGLVMTSHVLATFYYALLALRLCHGACSAGANVSSFGVATLDSSSEDRGRAISAVFSARAMAWALGSASGGWIASQLGLYGMFLLAGGLVLVVMLLLIPLVRRSETVSPASS